MHLKTFLLLCCPNCQHTTILQITLSTNHNSDPFSADVLEREDVLAELLSSSFPPFVFPRPTLCLTFSPSCPPLLSTLFPFYRPLFRDHSKILVGDGRGRVFSWSVSDQPGRSAADHWVKDEVVDSCSGCTVRFSLTERRHHCRNCGQLFCQK